MNITLKIYEGEDGAYKNPEDAILYMKETNFENHILVYDIDSDKAYQKTYKIYEAIKEYNKGKPLNDQILPTNPFGCRGIVGCLGVAVYEIDLGTYEDNHECVALFSGYNSSVLDRNTEKPNIRPSLKALSSLAMMAGFIE
jgi:hypothetical protein